MTSWNLSTTGEKGLGKSFGLILPHVKLGVSCHLPRGGQLLENPQLRVLAESLGQFIFSHCCGWEVLCNFHL